MTRTSLIDRFLVANCGGQDCVASGALHYSDRDILSAIGNVPLTPAAASQDVALCLEDPFRMTLALLALDGSARRLLLLSPSTPETERFALIRKFAPSTVLTDIEVYAPGADVVRWVKDRKQTALSSNQIRQDTIWTLATSGTTGAPRLVEHRLDSLSRRTRDSNSRFQKLRWGQLFEMSRFAGVQVLLQGLLGGGGLILPAARTDLGATLALFAEQGCSALSATPTMWRKILMTSAPDIPLRQVTLGGEIVDDAILSALAQRYPGARICHIYASTEAGAAFSVTDGRAGFPADYLAHSLGGIELRVRDGELEVRNVLVARRYLGEATPFADEEGFIHTGDVVRQVNDRFFFQGRRAGMINVGGNKLYPEEVERILLEDVLVAQAHVYGKNSPITGQLVAADIVITKHCGSEPRLITSLKARCRAALQPWQVPAAIKIVEELEAGSSGKLRRVRA